MNERGIGNRGQEGLTLTTLLLIILGVVAVVVIVLFFTGFFGKLGNASNNLPSDLQAAVSACQIDGSSGLQTDYCSVFRKVTVNGQEQYITCDAIAKLNYITDKSKTLVCTTAAPVPGDFCKAQNLAANTIVGGMKCTGDYSNKSTSYAA